MPNMPCFHAMLIEWSDYVTGRQKLLDNCSVDVWIEMRLQMLVEENFTDYNDNNNAVKFIFG